MRMPSGRSIGSSQLRGIIRTLISAVGTMRSNSDGPYLAEIEERIMDVQTLDGLAVTREDLELALGQLMKSERKRKLEAAALLTRLQERLLILEEYANTKTAATAQTLLEQTNSRRMSRANSESALPSVPVSNGGNNIPIASGLLVDRLTGLPNREAAEAPILTLEMDFRDKHLAAFNIQNMRQLNVCFGDRICDELLCLITQRIATTLLRPARIFRWRGPAFATVLEREESFSYVNHDLKRFVEHPFQFEFRSGNLLVFTSIAAELVGVECCSAAERVQDLEKFFSSF
jgi:GGDEF domain-containing protein